jgi:hypothetical protein
MTFQTWAQWYAILGLFTCILGIYRAWKYNIVQDELTVWTWFICWWFWLPSFVLRKLIIRIYTFFKKK